jgi:hypothetical protein
MAQVVDEPAYVAQIAQSIFAKIQGSRDAVSRTGHSIALGCLHRYVGGMGAGQHTQTSVSILLALAQDMSSSVVQVTLKSCHLKVIPQFCIAHFYCAHLITYNFIHYTYRLKQNIIL